MAVTKNLARVAGTLFLVAMFASLLGGGILESVLSAGEYVGQASANAVLIWTGVGLELVNAIAVVGIAVVLLPVIRLYNESVAFGYLGFRIIEAIFCVFAAIAPLFMLVLGQEYLQGPSVGSLDYHGLSLILISLRSISAGLLIPVFFALGALLFYYSMYRLVTIPKFISVWGLVAVLTMLLVNFLNVGTVLQIILALPIILNEIFLGVWLIVRGFNSTVTTSTD